MADPTDEKKDEKKEDKTSAADYGKRAAKKALADAKEFKGALSFASHKDASGQVHLRKAIDGFREDLKASLVELGVPSEEKYQEAERQMMLACEDLRRGLQAKQRDLVREGRFDEKEWTQECKTAQTKLETQFDAMKALGVNDAQKNAIEELKTAKIKALKETVEDNAIKAELKSLDSSLDRHRTIATSTQMGHVEAKRLGYYALSTLSEEQRKELEAKNIKETLKVFHPRGISYEEQKEEDQEALDAEIRGVDFNNKLMDQIRLLNEAVHGNKSGEPVIFESESFKDVKFILNKDGSIRTMPPGDGCKNVGGAMDMLLLTGAQSFVLKVPNPENIKTIYGINKILNILEIAANDKQRVMMLDSGMMMRLHELRDQEMQKSSGLKIRGRTIIAAGNATTEAIDKILAMQEEWKKQSRLAQKAQEGRTKENDARENQVDADIKKLKEREDKGTLIKIPQDPAAAKQLNAALSSGPRAPIEHAVKELLKTPNVDAKDAAKVSASLGEIGKQLDKVQADLIAAQKGKTSIDQQIEFLTKLAQEHPQDGILHGNFIAKLSEKSGYLDRQLHDLELRAEGWQAVLSNEMKPVLAAPDDIGKAAQLGRQAEQLKKDAAGARVENAKLLEPATTAGSLKHSQQEIAKIINQPPEAKQDLKPGGGTPTP